MKRRKTLSISAKRAFSHKEASRTFKMGAKLRMLYGYFDMVEGGAFSDIVEIPLDEDADTRLRVVPPFVLATEAAADAKRAAALAKATAAKNSTAATDEDDEEDDEDFYEEKDDDWGGFGKDFE